MNQALKKAMNKGAKEVWVSREVLDGAPVLFIEYEALYPGKYWVLSSPDEEGDYEFDSCEPHYLHCLLDRFPDLAEVVNKLAIGWRAIRKTTSQPWQYIPSRTYIAEREKARTSNERKN